MLAALSLEDREFVSQAEAAAGGDTVPGLRRMVACAIVRGEPGLTFPQAERIVDGLDLTTFYEAVQAALE